MGVLPKKSGALQKKNKKHAPLENPIDTRRGVVPRLQNRWGIKVTEGEGASKQPKETNWHPLSAILGLIWSPRRGIKKETDRSHV